jgi:hypothetical protein
MSEKQATSRTEISNWFVNNPKILGGLWAVTLLLTEIGPVLADGGGGTSGP